MRFAACPAGRFARPSWSSEARDAAPAPSSPRVLPQARRRRALALVQPADGCDRGDTPAHRDPEPARGQDLRRAGGSSGPDRLVAGSLESYSNPRSRSSSRAISCSKRAISSSRCRVDSRRHVISWRVRSRSRRVAEAWRTARKSSPRASGWGSWQSTVIPSAESSATSDAG